MSMQLSWVAMLAWAIVFIIAIGILFVLARHAAVFLVRVFIAGVLTWQMVKLARQFKQEVQAFDWSQATAPDDGGDEHAG